MRPLRVANSTSVSDNRLEPWLGLMGNSLNGSLNNSLNNSLNGAQVVADVGLLSPPFTLLSVTTIHNDDTPRWPDRSDNPGSQGQGTGTFGGPPGATVKMRPLRVANSTSVSDNRLEPWLGLMGNSLNGSLNNSLNNSLNGAQVVADVGVLSPPFTLLSVTTTTTMTPRDGQTDRTILAPRVRAPGLSRVLPAPRSRCVRPVSPTAPVSATTGWSPGSA